MELSADDATVYKFEAEDMCGYCNAPFESQQSCQFCQSNSKKKAFLKAQKNPK